MDNGFLGLMEECLEKKVKIQRHGPDSAVGTLRYCGSDFVGLETEDGEMVVYPTSAIEAFGVVVDAADGDDDNKSMAAPEPHPEMEKLSQCSTMADIFTSYGRTIVKVGRGGPGQMTGLLLELGDDYITMVSDIKEIVHIHLDHVKSLTVGTKRAKQNDSQSNARNNAAWEAWFGKR